MIDRRNALTNATVASLPRWACVNAVMIVVKTGNAFRRPLSCGPSRSATAVRTSTSVAVASSLNAEISPRAVHRRCLHLCCRQRSTPQDCRHEKADEAGDERRAKHIQSVGRRGKRRPSSEERRVPGHAHGAPRIDDREGNGSNQASKRRVSRLRAERGALLDGHKDEHRASNDRRT